MYCRSTARSFFTVLDQTKLPAPVWRCSYEGEALSEFARSKAAWKHGATTAIQSSPLRSKQNQFRSQ
jgi:hypothetical protein